MKPRCQPSAALVILFFCAYPYSSLTAGTFANFESPQAHSIAVADNGNLLYAINTPNNSLSVFTLDEDGKPTLATDISVGIEPVSMALRTQTEAWVVNHISDSISVIDLELGVVTSTIQVGDRPGDIVFAGNPARAFVTSMTERTVQVIDLDSHEIVHRVHIPGNDPRTLLASVDGKRVWVAIYRSGNKTTVVPHTISPRPPKPTNDELPPAPDQGIIVQTDDPNWSKLKVELADEDVFEIDSSSFKISSRFQSVGTILFNLAQHPGSGDLWVANTEARNLVRFEPVLQGHIVYNQIALLTDPQEQTQQLDLNPEFDYDIIPNPHAVGLALAQPTDIIFDASGEQAYVTSYGTDRIGVVSKFGHVTSRIEIGDSTGAETESRTKRGPRALAMHPSGDILYVMNRLSNSVSFVDLDSERVIGEVDMVDLTPTEIRQGRGYLFDAKLSGNGTVSCASCHVDGDRDGLAWDLGDPGGQLFNNGSARPLHPMKGPLMTQTLKGMAGERIFHWRADRPGLETFNGAFRLLMGGDELSVDDLATFVIYMRNISFGPNPLDNSGSLVQRGKEIFETQLGIGKEGKNRFRCIDCHSKPTGAGTTGFTGLIGQPTKAAQLRGLNERLVFTGGDFRVNGFGYGADGSKSDLIAFLSDAHRFGSISTKDQRALEAFLLAFPTETPGIVGKSLTVDVRNKDDRALQARLDKLLSAAESGNCLISVNGLLAGKRVSFQFDPADRRFHTVGGSIPAQTRSELMKAVNGADSVLTFLALPNKP